VLGHSYLYALAAQLRDERRTASEAVLCQEFWAYSVLPQVVDHFETIGFQADWIKTFNGDDYRSMRSSWEDLNVEIRWPIDGTRAFNRATVAVTGPPDEPAPIIPESVTDEESQQVLDVLRELGVELNEDFNPEQWVNLLPDLYALEEMVFDEAPSLEDVQRAVQNAHPREQVLEVLEELGVELGEEFNPEDLVEQLPHLLLLDANILGETPTLQAVKTALQNAQIAFTEWVNERLTPEAQGNEDNEEVWDLYVQYRELDGLEMYDSMEAFREACEALDDS